MNLKNLAFCLVMIVSSLSFSQCPEMDIQGNSFSIVSGDNTPESNDGTYFGQVNFGNFIDQSFSILNTGPVDLDLDGSPLISITGSVDFTVVLDPDPIVASNGGTTMFTIRYSPSMAGTINTATLSIPNNDCEEDPYTFDISGQSSTLNIGDNEIADRFRIYPNPNRGEFKIDIPEFEDLKSVKLYSIEGKVLKNISTTDVQKSGSIRLLIESGIYLAEVKTSKYKIIKKLLIY